MIIFMGKIFFILVLLIGCARVPVREPQKAMRLSHDAPQLIEDDLDISTFLDGVKKHLDYLKKQKPEMIFYFGDKAIRATDYGAALENFWLQAKEIKDKASLTNLIRERFDFYEVYGDRKWGEVFITSYFDPVITGSKQKKEPWTQALYRVPDDMVIVQLDDFFDRLPQLASYKKLRFEQKSSGSVLRGRLVSTDKDSPAKIVSYYDRREIDVERKLEGRKLELVWVDPIDAFFLQIQGSGIINLREGEQLRVGYAGQNGHPYEPIGKYLFDVIPKEQMSLQTIEHYLRTLRSDALNEMLAKNPSYVFFRKLSGPSLTTAGTETVAGRTIATDASLFPKGVLAYLEFSKPVFESEQSQQPTSWQKTGRLVIDQDTGGAIRGPGRVDLYWGVGPEAKQCAGVMKQYGRLQYLVPK